MPKKADIFVHFAHYCCPSAENTAWHRVGAHSSCNDIIWLEFQESPCTVGVLAFSEGTVWESGHQNGQLRVEIPAAVSGRERGLLEAPTLRLQQCHHAWQAACCVLLSHSWQCLTGCGGGLRSSRLHYPSVGDISQDLLNGRSRDKEQGKEGRREEQREEFKEDERARSSLRTLNRRC